MKAFGSSLVVVLISLVIFLEVTWPLWVFLIVLFGGYELIKHFG